LLHGTPDSRLLAQFQTGKGEKPGERTVAVRLVPSGFIANVFPEGISTFIIFCDFQNRFPRIPESAAPAREDFGGEDSASGPARRYGPKIVFFKYEEPYLSTNLSTKFFAGEKSIKRRA
jgi:hypothetical protein